MSDRKKKRKRIKVRRYLNTFNPNTVFVYTTNESMERRIKRDKKIEKKKKDYSKGRNYQRNVSMMRNDGRFLYISPEFR